MACQMGAFRAAPMPSKNVKPSTPVGRNAAPSVSTPSPVATTAIKPCVNSSSLRRSTKSAMTPAGMLSRKAGSEVAVCIRATSRAEVVRVVTSHTPATFCIQVPTLRHQSRNPDGAEHGVRKRRPEQRRLGRRRGSGGSGSRVSVNA